MKRIQRKRTKGWKMPPLTKCVHRGTKWGNDFEVIGHDGIFEVVYPGGSGGIEWLYRELANGQAVHMFRADMEIRIKEIGLHTFIKVYLEPFAPFENLACFCPLDIPCHGDVWIEYLERYGVTN